MHNPSSLLNKLELPPPQMKPLSHHVHHVEHLEISAVHIVTEKHLRVGYALQIGLYMQELGKVILQSWQDAATKLQGQYSTNDTTSWSMGSRETGLVSDLLHVFKNWSEACTLIHTVSILALMHGMQSVLCILSHWDWMRMNLIMIGSFVSILRASSPFFYAER